MALEVHTEIIGEVLKFALKGKLLASDAQSLGTSVQSQLQEHRKLLFDLADMTEIDYNGLHALVSSLQWAYLKGCTAKLAAIQPVPRILFDITRVSQVFECFETADEALQALQDTSDAESPSSP